MNNQKGLEQLKNKIRSSQIKHNEYKYGDTQIRKKVIYI